MDLYQRETVQLPSLLIVAPFRLVQIDMVPLVDTKERHWGSENKEMLKRELSSRHGYYEQQCPFGRDDDAVSSADTERMADGSPSEDISYQPLRSVQDRSCFLMRTALPAMSTCVHAHVCVCVPARDYVAIRFLMMLVSVCLSV